MEPQVEDFKTAIAFLVLGNEAMIEDEQFNHSFVYTAEGDGWNEPLSDSGDCHCGWQGLSWVQIDPACSGRPQIYEYVLEWVKHIREDVWKEDEDEGVSQDSDAVQERLDGTEEANDRGRLDNTRLSLLGEQRVDFY